MIGLAVSSEHVSQAHLLDLEVVVARIGAEIVGQIGFTGAGRADDNDIGVMLDILVAFQAFQQISIEMAVWKILDISQCDFAM